MPHIVVGALVDVDRVLLGHRSPSRQHYPNVWDLPGGHVEQGESDAEALVRELHEELNVQVVESDLVALTRLELSAGEAAVTLSIYRVGHWQGAVSNQCPDEHDRLGWFGAGDVGGLALAHASLWPVLQELLTEP